MTAVRRMTSRVTEQGSAPAAGVIVSRADPAISYRCARAEDVTALAPRLRTQDLAEVNAVAGLNAKEALMASFTNGKQCWSVLASGRVIAMFGVGRIANKSDTGLVWMLGSDEALQHPRALLRDGPAWVRELMKGHKAIGNFVSAENEAYIRWLRYLGFRLVRLHERFGVTKKTFWEFGMTAGSYLLCAIS